MIYLLYACTLFFELVSVFCRFAIVYWPLSWMMESSLAMGVAAIVAFAPLVYSLLVVCGLPSGHMLTRYRSGGRRPSVAEQKLLDNGLRDLRDGQFALPSRIYVLDRSGLNAAVSGTTMFVYRDLLRSHYLPAVVAHELGHLHSGDGRVLLALSALVLPGGNLIMFLSLSALRLFVQALVLVLFGILSFLLVMFRISLAGLVAPLLGISIQLARYLIIFAVGGVGTSLLGSMWRSYFLNREYHADAFAVHCGYGKDLMSFFRDAMLEDVYIPWNAHPTHPPTDARIQAIQALLASTANSQQPAVKSTASPSPLVRSIAIGSGAIVILALLGTLLFGLNNRPTTTLRVVPTPGPTPTLGILLP
jgi:Zn-dependent protease with chaperone function